MVGREGVAAAALVLRWGSYLAVLLDRDKPVWPEALSPRTSRISDEEMARISIEASAALAEWIDLYRADRGGRLTRRSSSIGRSPIGDYRRHWGHSGVCRCRRRPLGKGNSVGRNYRELYGQLAGNPSINDTIYRCFEDLPEHVVRKFAAKLQHQVAIKDEEAAMHTYRELLFGAHLARVGYRVEYERPLSRKTPDWTLMADAVTPAAIVDVVNYHLARELEDKAGRSIAAGEVAAYFPENEKRLPGKIDEKAGVYAKLAREHRLPYVVALFANFVAGVDGDDLGPIVAGDDSVFQGRPWLSGLLYMYEGMFPGYRFRYYPNPHAVVGFELQSGA